MVYAYEHNEGTYNYTTVIAVCDCCGEIKPIVFDMTDKDTAMQAWDRIVGEFEHQGWHLYADCDIEEPIVLFFGKNQDIKAQCPCEEDREYIVIELVDGNIKGISSDYGSVIFKSSYPDTWIKIVQALCESAAVKGNCEVRIGPDLADYIRSNQ